MCEIVKLKRFSQILNSKNCDFRFCYGKYNFFKMFSEFRTKIVKLLKPLIKRSDILLENYFHYQNCLHFEMISLCEIPNYLFYILNYIYKRV